MKITEISDFTYLGLTPEESAEFRQYLQDNKEIVDQMSSELGKPLVSKEAAEGLAGRLSEHLKSQYDEFQKSGRKLEDLFNLVRTEPFLEMQKDVRKIDKALGGIFGEESFDDVIFPKKQ